MAIQVLITCRTCGVAAPSATRISPVFVTEVGFYVDADVELPVGWTVTMAGSRYDDVCCPACAAMRGGGGGEALGG